MINFYTTRVRPQIKRMGRAIGIKPSRSRRVKRFPPDFDEQTIRIFNAVNEYTMTSSERVQALINAVRYIVANNIGGDIVECGVWRGGSMMAAALTLREMGDESRDLYLYDTFEGMNAPVAQDGQAVIRKFNHRRLTADSSDWCRSPIEAGGIAILRLDTDFYESTRQEMLHLYPELVRNGVIIIDDYGSYPGSRKAVDEYLAQHKSCLLLNRVDSAARIAIKT
jgi:hypothetical protein